MKRFYLPNEPQQFQEGEEKFGDVDTPTIIRQGKWKVETLEEEAQRIKEETAYEENWAELHGAYQDESGEWQV